MAKLTKASFARAQKALGIKKVTKKNIGRIARKARGGSTRSKSRVTRRKTPARRKRRMARRKNKGSRRRTLSLGVVTVGIVGGDLVAHHGLKGNPLWEFDHGNWRQGAEALLSNASSKGLGVAAKLLLLQLGKAAVGNPKIIQLGRLRINAL